ncbi:hypothetical protein Hanom_Chr06g00499701 [Helianthus anomalus]
MLQKIRIGDLQSFINGKDEKIEELRAKIYDRDDKSNELQTDLGQLTAQFLSLQQKLIQKFGAKFGSSGGDGGGDTGGSSSGAPGGSGQAGAAPRPTGSTQQPPVRDPCTYSERRAASITRFEVDRQAHIDAYINTVAITKERKRSILMWQQEFAKKLSGQAPEAMLILVG